MANGIVNRQVNVYINSGEAQKAYDILINREKALNAELAKTADPKRIKSLKSELDKLAEPLDRASKKLKGDLAPSIRDLELATKKFLSEFKKTGDPATLKNFQKFKAELDSAKAKLNGLEKAQGGLTKGGMFSAAFWANLAAGGIAAVVSQISGFFSGTLQEALDADAATKRLQSTLNNLGRSDAFDRITNKAQNLADQFRYLDNDDIVSVFNKLIDYGKLTEKEMNDLLPVIINFAAKSQISIDESASIIIKALEGNGKALKEYGIDISNAKTETDRMNIVMTTLKEKVDGAGESFQNSAKGGIATARQELNNLKEDIGNKLIPMLNKLLLKLSTGLTNLGIFFKAIKSRFNGQNAFVQIAIDEINSDPVLQEGVRNQTETLISSVTGAQSQIEKQLKRKLDLTNKKDLQILKESQKKRLDGLKSQLEQDKKDLNELLNNSQGRDVQLEARDLAMSVLARTDAISQLELLLNPEKTSLGLNGTVPDPPKIDKSTEAIKRFLAAWKTGLNEIADFTKNSGFINESAPDLTGNFNEFLKSLMPAGEAYDPSIAIAMEKMMRDNANRLDQLNFTILTTRGRKQLKAQQDLLDEQERQEIAKRTETTGLTETQVSIIHARYAQQRADLDIQYQEQLLGHIKEFAERALSIQSQFDQLKTERENAELARDQRLNDRKRSNLERRLSSGKISQLEYDRELQKIEAAQQKREKEIHVKQFQRQKRASIAQALIDGAMAISQIFRTVPKVIPGTIFPNPEFPIALGAAIAEKIATVAFIAAQKPPEFAKGGMLGGRSHAAGGNAIIDGSGRKIAEIEAGEGITNKHTMADRNQYTVSGTPSQIVSRLNGMHGGVQWEGGAQLIPAWQSISPTRMNYAASARRYATGGLFAQQNGSSGGAGVDNSVLLSVQATISQLNRILANGIPAYTLLTQNERQQARITSIRADAVMKP